MCNEYSNSTDSVIVIVWVVKERLGSGLISAVAQAQYSSGRKFDDIFRNVSKYQPWL